MTHKRYSLLLFVGLLLCACSSQKYDSRLVEIDSLLRNEEKDSAIRFISKLDVSNYSEKDKAYYYLLSTIAKHKKYITISSDSDISFSVSTFEKIGDKEKLAWAYLYSGYVNYDLGKYKKSLLDWKRAETNAEGLNNPELLIRILSNISLINGNEGNHQESINYYKSALNVAINSKKRRWIGYCLDHLAVIFSHIGRIDSCNYYVVKSIPYAEDQPLEERQYIYNNVARYYWRQKDYKKAEEYLRKSLSLKPWEMTYGILAEMLMEQGRMTEADSLWGKAMVTDDKEVRARLMWPYSEWLWKRGRKQEAWDVAMQLPMLKDTLANKRQAEALQSLQYGYEQQLSELHHRNDIQTLVIIALLVALSLMVGCSVVWLRLRKTKKRLMVTQNEIDAYSLRLKVEQAEIGALKRERQQLKISHTSKTRQLRELQDQESALNKQLRERERKVRDLQDKMQVLREEQGEMLARGKRLYDEIVSGGTTRGWHKRDYVDFLSYYRMDHRDFFDEIKENGSNLTPREKCFLAFYDMGFDKQQILLIMGLTKSAYRTVISRIKGKGSFYNFPE